MLATYEALTVPVAGSGCEIVCVPEQVKNPVAWKVNRVAVVKFMEMTLTFGTEAGVAEGEAEACVVVAGCAVVVVTLPVTRTL